MLGHSPRRERLRRGRSFLKPGYALASFGEDQASEIDAVDGELRHAPLPLVDADGPLAVLTVPASWWTFPARAARGSGLGTDAREWRRDATRPVAAGAGGEATSIRGGDTCATGPCPHHVNQSARRYALRGCARTASSSRSGTKAAPCAYAYSGLLSGDAALRGGSDTDARPGAPRGPRGPRLPGAPAERDAGRARRAPRAARGRVLYRSDVGLLHAGDPATGPHVSLRVTVRGAPRRRRTHRRRFQERDAGCRAVGGGLVDRVLLALAGLRERLGDGRAPVEGAAPFRVRRRERQRHRQRSVRRAPRSVGRKADKRTLQVAVHNGAFTTELCLTNRRRRRSRLLPSQALRRRGRDAAAPGTTFASGGRACRTSSFYRASATWLQFSSNGGAAAFHASARTFSSATAGGTFGSPIRCLVRRGRYSAYVYGLSRTF